MYLNVQFSIAMLSLPEGNLLPLFNSRASVVKVAALLGRGVSADPEGTF